MSDNQQAGQDNGASTDRQAGAGQQNQQAGQHANPGGSNPSGGGQPSQSGSAGQQGGTQQSQSGKADQQGAGLDEEDITQSPSRDSSLQQGSDNSNRGGDQQSR